MLISIVIPVRDRAATLPRLFRSLLAQAYRPLEIVLVDNASTDESLSLCRTFRKAHDAPGFRVRVEQEPTPGACRCRNRGLDAAQGEYTYFFDSDDEISADFLTACRPHFGQDLICANARVVFPDGRTRRRAFRPSARPADHILVSTLSTQTVLARTGLLRRIGRWDESLPRWNDWEWALRLLLHGPRISWMKKDFHRIHQHADSISGRSYAEDYGKLGRALDTAEADVRRLAASPAVLDPSLKALAARWLMLSAWVQREGRPDLAAEARARALRLLQGSPLRFPFLLLRRLAACGLHGTWRAYRLFV